MSPSQLGRSQPGGETSTCDTPLVGTWRGSSEIVKVVPGVDDHEDVLDLINTELTGRLARQGAAGGQVDTKAALVAGVAATATQFLATRPHPHGALAAAFVAYAGAFLAAVGSYALTRYKDVPDPRGLVRERLGGSKAEALAYLVATRVDVFESNAGKHQRKVRLWWVSVGLLVAGLALSAAALVQTDHHGRPAPRPAASPGAGAAPHADG